MKKNTEKINTIGLWLNAIKAIRSKLSGKETSDKEAEKILDDLILKQ